MRDLLKISRPSKFRLVRDLLKIFGPSLAQCEAQTVHFNPFSLAVQRRLDSSIRVSFISSSPSSRTVAAVFLSSTVIGIVDWLDCEL